MSTPQTLDYVTLDVFTQTPFKGNPLAVVLVPSYLSPLLSQSTKQLIAREFNYSETTFLHLPAPSTHRLNPDTAASVPTWRLDIFLTDAEVPLAGHPVIGSAFHALKNLAGTKRGRFVTKAGEVELAIDDAGEVRAVIPHDVHLHRHFRFGAADLGRQQPALARHLGQQGLEAAGIETLSIVKGMTFVFVELGSVEALGKVEMFAEKPKASELDEGWEGGVLMMMFYVRVGGEEGVTKLRTRMMEGLFEDPATGSASCGLGCLLALKEGLEGEGLRRFEMTQAVEMGRQSDIGVEVDVKGGEIKSVALKGTAVQAMKGSVRYE
ncbi:NAP1-binding protein 2 [Elsinoe australis]|uniref:NAP1-binding protein 2 n=1 Tax=Elsinoe australis TaxID=40998 RepID=A0A2P7ZE73_9PEZI|nr:NAP1-binding protein 2 [Elsinoe australis]